MGTLNNRPSVPASDSVAIAVVLTATIAWCPLPAAARQTDSKGKDYLPPQLRQRVETLNRVQPVEADTEKLLAFHLNFQELADSIRGFSIDLPAGAIDSDSGTFIIRTRGQAYSGDEFAQIPVRSANGAEVLLGEVATIHDASNTIRQRLSTLGWSMLQGGVLVMIILGVFIRPALAFWIVIGVPVSFAGAALFMPWFDITANVMSLFGFIIVLGIVVDDAIVTGENVYSKMRAGMPPLEAAVQGTHEVATPVTFGALTTVVAFIPLLFFDGTWGDFAKQIPPVVAPVLLFSLIESKLILPAHLKHLRPQTGSGFFSRFQAGIATGLEGFIARVYQPTLRWAVQYRGTVLAVFIAMALVMAGYCRGGVWVSFPSRLRTPAASVLCLICRTTRPSKLPNATWTAFPMRWISWPKNSLTRAPGSQLWGTY
jgi:multidrug efflux pump subunit AcrB